MEFLKAKDISEICQYSESKAYQVIRNLNEELEKEGKTTFKGRVIKSYFFKKMGLEPGDNNASL